MHVLCNFIAFNQLLKTMLNKTKQKKQLYASRMINRANDGTKKYLVKSGDKTPKNPLSV